MSDAPADSFEALSPSGPMGVPIGPAAARPGSLEGRRIALVWNHVFRGDEIFPVVEDALRADFAGIDFVPYSAFGSIMGADEEGTHDRPMGQVRVHPQQRWVND